MKNVIVDLGNYNIKYYGNSKGSFSAKCMTKFNPNGEMFERVEINGEIIYIGIGSLDREFNKVQKSNYLQQVLYAIDKATTEVDINLCLLLPVVQMPNKGAFINEFKEKIFSYRVNGKIRTVKINKVAVLPEGYSAYFAITDVNPNEDILVVDIGSRTVNYSWFCNNKVQDSFTEKTGVFDLYSNIKEYQNSLGQDFSEEDIERLITNNKITVETKFYMDFFKDVLNKTKGRINLKTFNVYFVGGGALLLRKFIEVNTPAKIYEDAEYANVIGAFRLCKAIWEDEN